MEFELNRGRGCGRGEKEKEKEKEREVCVYRSLARVLRNHGQRKHEGQAHTASYASEGEDDESASPARSKEPIFFIFINM